MLSSKGRRDGGIKAERKGLCAIQVFETSPLPVFSGGCHLSYSHRHDSPHGKKDKIGDNTVNKIANAHIFQSQRPRHIAEDNHREKIIGDGDDSAIDEIILQTHSFASLKCFL